MMQKKCQKFFQFNELYNQSNNIIKKYENINFDNISNDNKNILITGASGELGFLIASFLEDSKNIFVFYRNENDKIKKLKQKNNINLIKITGLEDKWFGLTFEEYESLSNKIDTIYHNAAIISNELPYSVMFNANVKGSLNILDFSINKKIKKIHYSSTLSVNISYIDYKTNELIKAEPLKLKKYQNLYCKNNYTATKVLVDLIYGKLSNKLPIYIYRLGLLLNENLCRKSYISLLLKELNKNKKVINGLNDWSFDYTPYDFAAKVIINNDNNKSFLNVSLNQKISISDIANYLNLKYVNKNDYPQHSWLNRMSKDGYIKHDIFEMRNHKGFLVDNNIEINKENIIKNWIKFL